MERQKYIEDIEEIKKIMDRSSRFISLSGLSGIIAGVFALVAAYLAYQTVYSGAYSMDFRHERLTPDALTHLILIGSVTIILSVICGIFLTTRKAKENNQSLFDRQAQLLVINLAIPLVTGGILCIILLLKGGVVLVAPLTLIFYGLALVNASKYTITAMRRLGLIEIVLGLVSCWFLGYGLVFWAIGFGVLHIVYGIVMYVNDKK